MPMQSARNPAGRARTGAWSSVAVVTRPLLLNLPILLLDVSAGELEEHVVERGLAQREVAHPDAATVERDRHRAEDRRPVECPDRELVAVDVDLVDTGDLPHGVARAFGAVLDPGDDHVRPERALQVRGRALLDQMSLIDDPDAVRELAEPLLGLRLGEAVEAALEAEELDAGLGGVERCLLERDADAEAHVDGLAGDVEPGHFGPPGGRKEEGAQHVDERRLARAVGTEEAVDLARLHVEVDAVDGAGLVEEPPKILRSYGRVRHGVQTYRHHGTPIADISWTVRLRRSHRAHTMRRCTDTTLSGFRESLSKPLAGAGEHRLGRDARHHIGGARALGDAEGEPDRRRPQRGGAGGGEAHQQRGGPGEVLRVP